MSRFLVIFIFGLFWGNQGLYAQKETPLVLATDSVKTKTLNFNAPAKAAFYSAVLPGLGQAYNKKYWKIPIVYGAIGAGLYYYTWNNKQYHRFRDEYKKRLNGTADPNDSYFGNLDKSRLIDGQRFYQRNRDLSALITAGLYILNIVDANVDAHLMQFNVNENLTVKPDIYQNDFNYKHSLGVTLNLNF